MEFVGRGGLTRRRPTSVGEPNLLRVINTIVTHLTPETIASVLSNIDGGIAICDARQVDFPTVFISDTFAEMTGYSKKEILGNNMRMFQGPKTSQDTKVVIREALEREERISVTILNYRKDGTTFWNGLTIAPVRDNTGEVVYFVGINSDITEYVDARILRNKLIIDEIESLNSL